MHLCYCFTFLNKVRMWKKKHFQHSLLRKAVACFKTTSPLRQSCALLANRESQAHNSLEGSFPHRMLQETAPIIHGWGIFPSLDVWTLIFILYAYENDMYITYTYTYLHIIHIIAILWWFIFIPWSDSTSPKFASGSLEGIRIRKLNSTVWWKRK